MLARCPPTDLGTILEAFGVPAFVAGPSAGGSTAVLAVNGRLLAALDGLSISDLTSSLEREFERCRAAAAPLELDREIALPRRCERWHLVLTQLRADDAVAQIVVTVAGRTPASPPEHEAHPESRIRAIVEEQAGLICRYGPDTTLYPSPTKLMPAASAGSRHHSSASGSRISCRPKKLSVFGRHCPP
jgi:hypothetical protein